jgi:hypothetical protein
MMGRREFLQLVDHHDPQKHGVAGWLISEKLDGTRCFRDGGVPKEARYRRRRDAE